MLFDLVTTWVNGGTCKTRFTAVAIDPIQCLELLIECRDNWNAESFLQNMEYAVRSRDPLQNDAESFFWKFFFPESSDPATSLESWARGIN